MQEYPEYPHQNRLWFNGEKFTPSGEIDYYCDGIWIRDVGALANPFVRDFNSGKFVLVFPITCPYALAESVLSNVIASSRRI